MVLGDNEVRPYLDALLKALDQANNNANFV